MSVKLNPNYEQVLISWEPTLIKDKIPTNKADGRCPLIRLGNGKLMPTIGFGTWRMTDSECAQGVKDAVNEGYRHIDTAWIYGNEKGVGLAIKELINDKLIKREDIFVTSKIWNTYHGRKLAVQGIKESLENLGLKYLDLALIHFPTGFKSGTGDAYPKAPNGDILPSEEGIIQTWKGMEDFYRMGLAKSIGVSNFNTQQLERIVKVATIPPMVNQVRAQLKLKNIPRGGGRFFGS